MRTVPSVRLAVAFLFLLLPLAAAAFDSGSDGSDGAFSPVASTTIDLSLAGTGPGTGTYDPALWAVVFNFTDIDVPAGVTVDFAGHPSGAPVVWLASGDVTIAGTVSLAGAPSLGGGAAGPGGFAGGGFNPRTRGFGPGGAGFPTSQLGSGGSYGTTGLSRSGSTIYPAYGNEQILPLIGGSGGAPAGSAGFGGGGGGGAILVAASGTLTLDGAIQTPGGDAYGTSSVSASGAGSGGAVRLLATVLAGGGALDASGGNGGAYGAYGGDGRIRVEAESLNITASSSPAWTYDLTPGPVFQDATTPSVRITTINGQAVTGDPAAGMSTIDHTMGATGAVEVGIEANNVPVGTTVDVHVVREGSPQMTYTSTALAGSLALSTATATVSFDSLENTEIYLKVNW